MDAHYLDIVKRRDLHCSGLLCSE